MKLLRILTWGTFTVMSVLALLAALGAVWYYYFWPAPVLVRVVNVSGANVHLRELQMADARISWPIHKGAETYPSLDPIPTDAVVETEPFYLLSDEFGRRLYGASHRHITVQARPGEIDGRLVLRRQKEVVPESHVFRLRHDDYGGCQFLIRLLETGIDASDCRPYRHEWIK